MFDIDYEPYVLYKVSLDVMSLDVWKNDFLHYMRAWNARRYAEFFIFTHGGY